MLRSRVSRAAGFVRRFGLRGLGLGVLGLGFRVKETTGGECRVYRASIRLL